MSNLTIVIPCNNDTAECRLTVKSIRETSPPDEVEIIVIDDGSFSPFEIEGADVVRHSTRAGAGASRHCGISLAQSPYVLLTDSHMRFEPGWYDFAMPRIWDRPTTLHSAVCCGFTSDHPPFGVPDGKYYGANIDLKKFDGVWAQEREDDAELPCMMGAGYFIPRDWYLKLGGLQFLRSWGSEEMMLSLKTWLAGGEVRLLKDVHLWHKFRTKREKPPYKILIWHTIYNQVFMIQTMFPPDIAKRLMQNLRWDTNRQLAEKGVRDDWNIVVAQQVYNRKIFTRDFEWLCKKFGLALA